jgi:hypothetical protein
MMEAQSSKQNASSCLFACLRTIPLRIAQQGLAVFASRLPRAEQVKVVFRHLLHESRITVEAKST